MTKTALLTLLCLLTLSACVAPWPKGENLPIRHESFTLVYARDGTTLFLSEQARMNAFLSTLDSRFVEQIRIKPAQGDEAGIAAAAQLKSSLLRAGFSSAQIFITPIAGPSGRIVVWIEYRAPSEPKKAPVKHCERSGPCNATLGY